MQNTDHARGEWRGKWPDGLFVHLENTQHQEASKELPQVGLIHQSNQDPSPRCSTRNARDRERREQVDLDSPGECLYSLIHSFNNCSLSTFEQITELGAGFTVPEALHQGEGGDRHGTANYAISYLIINGDKCHEEVQGALTANKPGSDVIWRRREAFLRK